MKTISRIGLALFAALASSRSLPAADNSELQALREQVLALEQQIKVISRQIELKDEAASSAAATAPKITVNDKGFTLASADGANAIKLRGLVQLDSRLFFGDGGGVANNGFVLRRARIITEGTFAKSYSFQLVPEFGGSSISILDANIGVTLDKALQFKFGKFNFYLPVGYMTWRRKILGLI